MMRCSSVQKNDTATPQAFNVYPAADARTQQWFFNSGASTHMTHDAGILHNSIPYTGSSGVCVGNGTVLPITYLGSTVLRSGSRTFPLHNVLCCPALTHNLLSIQQFIKDNPCLIEFSSDDVSIKDQRSKATLLRCSSSHGLYTIPGSISSSSSPVALSAQVSPTLWHRRLGHANSSILRTLSSQQNISLSKTVESVPCLCLACQIGKHSRLSFTSSISHTSSPFELMHSDLWFFPVLSETGYRYFLSILDDYTHFCWVFPLRSKTEVYYLFFRFHTYIRTQFNGTIKSIQCDNGTEYTNAQFQTFCATQAIHFRASCPHTPQQNGKAQSHFG